MRAMWKGAVSFGLVNVPVRMYTATSSHDVAFHQVHREDGGRIKYRRVCSVCGEEVSYDEIAKGYESPDGQLVILTDEDLADLPVSGSREIEVERFVPAEQIDPMLLEKSYYLEPDRLGVKPYALLREALREADRMALVHVAIRNRSTLAVLRVRDDVIVLQTMLWPDEIRQPDFDTLGDASDLRPQELAMAASLVDSMTGDYDPEEFEDDYRDAVVSLLEGKVAGGDVSEAPAAREASSGGEVVDLLAALQRSVDQARSGRGEQPVAKPAKKTAAKKTAGSPAKKAAPAKKTAKSTKTAAKKAARRSA
ncbi:MAG TPA: Ku protein [Actinomycetales bacterium]|nr:Ku protein [Actinomycetales bacterium]